MSTATDARVGRTTRKPHLPAYGPIDAILGYGVFYVFVARVTATIVDVFTTTVPGLSAGSVQFGLAAILWFVFSVMLFDQLQRQLAAVGIGSRAAVARAKREAGTPGNGRLVAFLGVFIGGSAVAAWTFDAAVRTGIVMIRIVGTLDVTAFVLIDVLTLVAFFVAFGAATHSLDRIVIGSIRRVSDA